MSAPEPLRYKPMTPEQQTRAVLLYGVYRQRYALIEVAALITGYTVSAINQKIDSGAWREGKEWRKSPDGRRQVDLWNYDQWVEGAAPISQ